MNETQKRDISNQILKICNDMHLTIGEKIVLLKVTQPTTKRKPRTAVEVTEERIADLLIRKGLTDQECVDIFEMAYREAIKDSNKSSGSEG